MENPKIVNSFMLTAEKDDSTDSLGILDMDNIRAYGENSSDVAFNTKEINDKLKVNRQKALKTLELFEAATQRDQTQNISKVKNDSLKMDRTPESFRVPKTPGYDRTDYISYNSYKTLNITDLQAEHTINLELNTPVAANKISFEPSEITGRSTLYRGELAKKAEEFTVEEILASSYSGNVRNLRQSLNLNSTNQSRQSLASLPKTADMSKTSGTDSLLLTESSKGFSFSNARRDDESGFMGENFTPAELMSSKLYADEKSWAQKYQRIPMNYDSSNASDHNKTKSDISMISNFDENNVSQITEFFRKRSENLYNMVGSTESPKHHEPIALLDDTNSSTISDFLVSESDARNSTLSSQLKISDKTYQKENSINVKCVKLNQKMNEKKDESYMLSLSSIANALKQINSDESGTSVMNRLLSAKRVKSGLNPTTENLVHKNFIDNKKSYSLDPKNKLSTHQTKNFEQNKENFNPIIYNDKENTNQLCDTATFTESLLDTTDFKKMIQNETYDDTFADETNKQHLITASESSQNTLTNFNFSSSSPKLGKSNIIAQQTISLSKENLLLPPVPPRRSKSPSNLNELYAIAGASSKNQLRINNAKQSRKRSRSASNRQITNGTVNTSHSEKHSGSPNFNRNYFQASSLFGRLEKSPKKLIYPNSPKSQIHDNLTTHSEPKVSNPTITIDAIRELQRERNLRKTHSSTRLNNETSEIRSVSPNFHGTRTDFRSPSPIPTPEKSKYVNSPISSLYNSPKSAMSSPKYHNSPNSPISLESTTNSERRYLMASGNNHLMPSSLSVSPECIGKMSLPNYVTRPPNNLLVKSSLRCTSQCSTSSEFSHHDDKKLPIKVTCMQFSWGSIKLRTNSKKSMQIKNFSTKRLVLKVEISGPGFQIVNLENTSNLITLQSQECRTIVVNFCPTVLGIAIGVLSFLPPQENLTSSHKIPLYGYGGHAIVMPQGIQKGPIGLPFLTMGELQELSHPLMRTFTIYNKGPLTAFAVICLSSVGLDIPHLCDCIDIEPRKALIQPDDIVKFRVIFKPRRDDLRRIIKKISGVMTLATLRIITGDEPTRQRIRNIIRRMNDKEKSKITSATLDNCWKKFEQEILLNDINQFKEQTDVGLELVSTLRTHEIAITLNHTIMDDTTTSSHLMFPDVDETIMFRTIVSNSMYLKGTDSDHENNHNLEINIEQQERPNELWSVRPNKLEIDPFDKRIKTFFTLHSLCDRIVQDFEISSNFKHLFTISPSSGKLLPNENININVIFNQLSFLPNEEINIMVYMENEKITIPVIIKKDNFPPNFR